MTDSRVIVHVTHPGHTGCFQRSQIQVGTMTKTPKNSHNQAGQIVYPFDTTTAHPSNVAASCLLNTSLSSQEKSVSSMTFSQKFAQSQALEIAEEFEQALEANSLENLKQLFDKVLEISPSNK